MLDEVGNSLGFLTHYYKKGSLPFRSLLALPENKAMKVMEELSDDTPLFSRFKEPIQYLENRKETEKWFRDKFIEKGGQPLNEYPIYAVVGSSKWIEHYSSAIDIEKIQIPISIFSECDISFTYPDSMVSYTYFKEKPCNYYLPELHGKIFTISEVNHLFKIQGLPVESRETNLPEEVAPYFEAQIWNHKVLLNHFGILFD